MKSDTNLKIVFFCKVLLTAILFFSFEGTGYTQPAMVETEEDTVTTRPPLRIMTPGNMIPVAFDEQDAADLTASVSVVDGDALRRAPTASVTNMLYGRLPGLTVLQNFGEPGNDQATLFIRGLGTYNNPGLMFLVDGFEILSLDQVSAHEIESITILKDAAALALYGMRGANGAILVTTKRGVTGPVQIDFSAQTGFREPTRLPEFVGSYDYARLYNEALINDGLTPQYSESDLAAYQAENSPYLYPDVNWYDEVLRDSAPFQDYNLTFRGGGNVAKYFVHLGYLADAGLYANTDRDREINSNTNFQRYSFRSNLDIEVIPGFEVAIDVGGRIEDRASPNFNTALLWQNMARYPANAFPVRNPDDSWGGSSIYPDNPVASVLGRGFNSSHDRLLMAGIRLTQELLSNAESELSLTQAIASHNWHRGNYNRIRNYAWYELSGTEDDLIYTQRGTDTEFSTSEGGNNQWDQLHIQAGMDYKRQLADGQHLSVLLMYHQDLLQVSGGEEPFARQRVMGRFNYNYRSRYIAEAGISYSGSEQFPKGNRFGFFPYLSGAWILSNEHFLAGNATITFLKARVSVGLTGNDRLVGNRFAHRQDFFYGGAYRFGDQNTARNFMIEGMLPNPGVTWEKALKYNLGIETILFNRLNFAVDLFYEKRTDILASAGATVPGYVGVPVHLENTGKVNNRGLEIDLLYRDQAGPLGYYIGGTVFFSRNKIIEMNEVARAHDWMRRTGNPIGRAFGLEAIGFYIPDDFDENGILKPDIPVPVFGEVRPGDIRYRDLNNDGLIDEKDERAIGNPWYPELNAAFTLGASYKGFDLELLFQGIANRSVYLSGEYFWALQNNANIAPNALNRWTPETADQATYPRLTTQPNENNFRPSTFWIQSGEVLRLRNVELGYSIPHSLAERVYISGARIFIRGMNLFTWDKIKTVDPETLGGYPPLKSVNAGVQLQF